MWDVLKVVLHLADTAARWYIVRALSMAAPRRFRDRRRRDPNNVQVPPLVVATMATAIDNPGQIRVFFNAALDADQLQLDLITVDAISPISAVNVPSEGPNVIDLEFPDPLTLPYPIEFALGSGPPFGPNVPGGQSKLWLE